MVNINADENIPNELTIATIEAAENDEELHGPFDNIEDLMKALND